MEDGIIKELKKRKELTKASAMLIGSSLGYMIGRASDKDSATLSTMFGGFVASVMVEILLS